MIRIGKQLYMDQSVWKLVEEAAEKDKRSCNKWLEILLTSYFLKVKMEKK